MSDDTKRVTRFEIDWLAAVESFKAKAKVWRSQVKPEAGDLDPDLVFPVEKLDALAALLAGKTIREAVAIMDGLLMGAALLIGKEETRMMMTSDQQLAAAADLLHVSNDMPRVIIGFETLGHALLMSSQLKREDEKNEVKH